MLAKSRHTGDVDALTAAVLALVTAHAGLPLAVHGRGFHPREHVRVTIGARVDTVRASRTGTFVAPFPGLTLSRCGAILVRAAGSEGTAAALQVPRPACLPVRTP